MKSYKKLRKVTKSYKRVIKSNLEASCSEILEKWPPYKGPKSKFHFLGSDRFRSSEKPLHQQKYTFFNKMTSPHKN